MTADRRQLIRCVAPGEVENTLVKGQERIKDDNHQHGGTEEYVSTSLLYPGMKLFGADEGSYFILIDHEVAEGDKAVPYSGMFATNAGTKYMLGGRSGAQALSTARTKVSWLSLDLQYLAAYRLKALL